LKATLLAWSSTTKAKHQVEEIENNPNVSIKMFYHMWN
jgi:general stress protein 26